MKKILLASLIVSSIAIPGLSHAMVAMDDDSLSGVSGQALLSMEYNAGYNVIDAKGQNVDQTNLGFYKLGLEAEMEINANIKKLQLGCGGVNGIGKCDIDIDNISLSGLQGTNYTSDDRAASSALITNPFVEFRSEERRVGKECRL